jgi:hypothetical protein
MEHQCQLASRGASLPRWFLLFLIVGTTVLGGANGQPIIRGAHQSAGAQLSYGSYRFEPANYWGNELQIYDNIRDPQDCAMRCDADPRCWVASFHGPSAGSEWANRCVLRHAIGPRHTEQVDIWSWINPGGVH